MEFLGAVSWDGSVAFSFSCGSEIRRCFVESNSASVITIVLHAKHHICFALSLMRTVPHSSLGHIKSNIAQPPSSFSPMILLTPSCLFLFASNLSNSSLVGGVKSYSPVISRSTISLTLFTGAGSAVGIADTLEEGELLVSKRVNTPPSPLVYCLLQFTHKIFFCLLCSASGILRQKGQHSASMVHPSSILRLNS